MAGEFGTGLHLRKASVLTQTRECWCGDALSSTGVKASAESQCGMKCSGDPSELCGDGNRLTLVRRSLTVPKLIIDVAFVVYQIFVLVKSGQPKPEVFEFPFHVKFFS